jgi:thiamine biosynthesis protein ThiS
MSTSEIRPSEAGPRGQLRLLVNGEQRAVDAPCSVAALLGVLGLATEKVAVERNHRVVPRREHATTMLADGDRLEVVTFVGGG